MWREPVRGWPDVVARAKAALYWKWPRFENGQFEAYEALVREADDLDDGPLALLVHAILTLEGKAEHVGDHPPGKRLTSASEIDFEPVMGSDGKPLAFDYTNVEFADRYCPWIRLAFVLLGKDKQGVIDIVGELVNDPKGPQASHLLDALAMWEEIENKFEAVSAFSSAAFARMTTALEILEGEDPRITEALAPSVDAYLAARGQA